MRTGQTLPHPRPCAAKRTGILGHMGHTVVHVVGAPDAPPPLWDGRAGERIGEVIDHWLAAR